MEAVCLGHFSPALEYYIHFGSKEERVGTGIARPSFELTGQIDDLIGTEGDDIFFGRSENLTTFDRINDGRGNSTLEIAYTGLATIPSTTNLISIENIAIQDTVHQTLDFSALISITGIGLDSGTTVNGATINTTQSRRKQELSQNKSLISHDLRGK